MNCFGNKVPNPEEFKCLNCAVWKSCYRNHKVEKSNRPHFQTLSTNFYAYGLAQGVDVKGFTSKKFTDEQRRSIIQKHKKILEEKK